MIASATTFLPPSPLFSDISGLVHGITTRSAGDMRSSQNRTAVLSNFRLGAYPLVWLTQMHGNGVIAFHSDVPTGKSLENDGAVTNKRGVVLAVHVGDCVPVLFVDPVQRIIGVAHAGWRGTLAEISRILIDSMKSLGSTPPDVRVFMGPHIGMCCYTVPPARAQQFQKQFPGRDDVASFEGGAWHVDIGKANVLTLLAAGIRAEHIDAPVSCTSCQVDRFFSYRKDAKNTFGEIMGFIAYEKNN